MSSSLAGGIYGIFCVNTFSYVSAGIPVPARSLLKSSWKAFPLVFTFGAKGRLGEGGGIRREGVQVREGSRVGWIEETQRKTRGCGLKEGSDQLHVVFMSPNNCSLLCICDGPCLSLSVLYAETRACVAARM
jgi:hypothetical protein